MATESNPSGDVLESFIESASSKIDHLEDPPLTTSEVFSLTGIEFISASTSV